MMKIHDVGLPPSSTSGSSSGEGPNGSTGNQQDPITADLVGKDQKMNLLMIFVIALSAVVLLVVCFATTAILLNCRMHCLPSNTVESALASSLNKRFGKLACYSSGLTCPALVLMKMICGSYNSNVKNLTFK